MRFANIRSSKQIYNALERVFRVFFYEHLPHQSSEC